MAAIEKKQLQTFAEEYFSSQNYLNKRILEDVSKVRNDFDENVWSKMNVGEREKAITESLSQSEVQENSDSTRSEAITPGLVSSFPKIKLRTGQKFIVEDSNTADGKPYSYRDEHSAPFGWKTRSQQNLHFDIYSEPPLPGPGVDTVTARRSAILSCPFGQYSKMPKFAKPVSIPVVPSLPSKTEYDDLAEVTSLVSSVVIESENNIVLDFSSKCEEVEPDTPLTTRSDTSSASLLSKVIKKCKTPTLKRKKSLTSTDTLLSTVTDEQTPDGTPTTSTRWSLSNVSKPVCAPPPPPAPSLSRPSAPPPPPPTAKTCAGPPPPPPQRSPATKISTQNNDNTEEDGGSKGEKEEQEEISPIRKTGFDFLDNW